MSYRGKLLFVVLLLMASSCGKDFDTGNDLSRKDKKFIRKLGILDEEEKIILFDSQGGFSGPETSGNFFTDKRIASYWIDDRDSLKNHIESAFYTEVDTIWRYPKYHSLTLASYLEVHRKDGSRFKVYVGADSAGTWTFFNRALEEWSKNQQTTPR